MIATELHWVDGPWPGKIALAARPRGADWLADEIMAWRRSGADTVFSLLTDEEERDLELSGEAAEVRAQRMKFMCCPIRDRQVPDSRNSFVAALESLDSELMAGRNVVLHCRQGVGRTGLVAACLLIMKGVDAETALHRLSSVRGVPVPETVEQRRWIDQYADASARIHGA
jgi:protein-tyrosine phosphatase